MRCSILDEVKVVEKQAKRIKRGEEESDGPDTDAGSSHGRTTVNEAQERQMRPRSEDDPLTRRIMELRGDWMRNTAAALDARIQQETQGTAFLGAMFYFPCPDTDGLVIQVPTGVHILCREGTGPCVLTHLSDAEGNG